MVVRQVSKVPPLFPLPLHWLTRIGIAGRTLDAVPTVQAAVEPPPFAEQVARQGCPR